MSNDADYLNLFDLIDQCWDKNREQDFWFQWDKSRKLKEIGYCNICKTMIEDNYYDSFYDQVIEHGLYHYPHLKLFL